MKKKITIAIAIISGLIAVGCKDQNKPTPPTAFEDGKTHNWKIVYYEVNHNFDMPDTYRALDSTNVNTITYDSVSSMTNLANIRSDRDNVPRGTITLKKLRESKYSAYSDIFVELYDYSEDIGDYKITITLQN